MAIDNLNYYSSWLPAWQQTDKYSSQPWCLKSKNLDIFSSSKSVKATAWSEPEDTAESWVVLVDQTWDLILKSDWSVYDRSLGSEVLVKSDIATNFPSYNISYNWRSWTYEPATWGTEKQLISKYENWVLKYFTIFTDRARYVYSAEEYRVTDDDEVWTGNWWTESDGGRKKSGSETTTTLRLKVNNLQGFTTTKLSIQAYNVWATAEEWSITISDIRYAKQRYWYDAETDDIQPSISSGYEDISFEQLDDSTWKTVFIDIPLLNVRESDDYYLTISFKHTAWSDGTHTRPSWRVTVNVFGYNDAYNYLPINAERELVDVWEYYREKSNTFQVLYSWGWEWVDDDNMQKVVRYSLVKYMWRPNDVSMDVIAMIAWNEQIYMIGNMNWNWYVIPCDLTWGRGTPYIAYGCEFKWATNIDYLLYLVWEDRGISQLWVYNGQELVPVIWWKEEKDSKNLIKNEEQYRFDWKIVNWRKNLILTTTDNRIFQYWQTYGGKGGTFIHELPENATITWLKTNWNDLEISYSITEWQTTTKYSIKYQDDTPIKNYNIEWMAEYPIVLWNHLLEKEESDLYVSYILPSADCSLEFWGMANHYHFWTFTSEDDYTFDSELSYKLKWATWDYELKFIERNGNQYTFRLEWDLPIQTTNDMKITDSEWVELINYSEYNHFRKIWEITTEEYQEWEFRFHNLNNKLELPKSHSLQIMVNGKGNQNYTPELFALDLVANQRERW